MDGTGVPVVKKETAGRQGRLDGLAAHTREAKLGCVFTQTQWNDEGFAIRDLDSTTYIGAIETAEQFGKRLYVGAWKRGSSRAETKVVIGDGAEWAGTGPGNTFPAPFIRRLRCHRSWLQNRKRSSPQTVRHLLDCERRQLHPRAPLLPP